MVIDKYLYILEGKSPIPCNDLMVWGAWLETNNKHVAVTTIGSVTVSTVFLAIDHNFGEEPPLLFETMVFGGENLDGLQARYVTWEQAEAGHRNFVDLVQQCT